MKGFSLQRFGRTAFTVFSSDLQAGLIRPAFSSILLVLMLVFAPGCAWLESGGPARQQEVQARMDLCKSYLQNQKPRKGLKELLAIEDRAAGNPEFHFLMGLVQMQLKDFPKAADAFQKAVELDPDYGQAWNNLGRTLIEQEKYIEAENALQRALAVPTYLTPEYPAYNLARMFEKQGREALSLEYAQLALEHSEGFAPAVLLLAEGRLEQGRIEEAVAVLHKGLAQNPNNSQLMLALAENYLRLGDNRHAKKWFQRILDLVPASAEAQVAKDYLDILP